MVKNYFRLTLVYMTRGDHRNPSRFSTRILGMKNPARTKRSSGVSLAGDPALSLKL